MEKAANSTCEKRLPKDVTEIESWKPVLDNVGNL